MSTPMHTRAIPPAAPCSVLFVEDEPVIRDCVSEYFKEIPDVSVTCASTGSEAEQAMAQRHWDLAIIEVALTQQSGFELASRAANKNTAVLLMSGHPELVARLEDFQWPHITKPFSLAGLRREAWRALTETDSNVRHVKVATALMALNSHSLKKQQLGRIAARIDGSRLASRAGQHALKMDHHR